MIDFECRVTGYLAHWRESLMDPDTKIIRPQQVYKGEGYREYIDLNNRKIDGYFDLIHILLLIN